MQKTPLPSWRRLTAHYFLHPASIYITLMVMLLSTAPARATITVLDYYRMGENDSGFVQQGAVTVTAKDSIGTKDLNPEGTTYSAAVAATAAAATGSRICVYYGGYSYGTNTVLSTATDNFGIEAWVNPASFSNNPILAYNGNTGTEGWGIVIQNSTYQGLFGGITYLGSFPATAGTWAHVALVRNSGVATLYVNGVAQGTSTSTPNVPAGNFGVATAPSTPGSQLFNGSVDEVRVFTFTAGQFATNDLLYFAGAPAATTAAAAAVTSTTATLNGSVTPHGLTTTASFQYGLTTGYGSTANVATNAGYGSAAVNVSGSVSGLSLVTTYHYRTVAANSVSTNYGTDQTFTTLASAPTITSATAVNIAPVSASLTATVNPNGATTSGAFQWGPTASYGNSTPVTSLGGGTSAVTVSNNLTGLVPATVYHYQLLVTNAQGTAGSGDKTFSTLGVVTNVTGTGLPALSGAVAAWGDYDNDGDLDLLLTGYNGVSNSCALWRNNGNGTFTQNTVVTGLPAIYNAAAAWGDYDNDGNLDFVVIGSVAGSSLPVTQVWHNNGDGTFTRDASAGITGVAYGAVAWGDYDNDGKPDLALCGHDGTNYNFQIWHNNGNGSFNLNANAVLNSTISATGLRDGSVAWGDYDGDGNLDLLVAGQVNGAPVCQILRNLGNGTFTNINAGLTGLWPATVAWGDYDNDGKLDALLAGGSTNNTAGFPTNLVCQVWNNLGAGSFANLNAGLPGVMSGSVAWGDYDNDGKLDILLTGITNGGTGATISQLWHNSGGIFTNSLLSLPGIGSGSGAWGDFNNDGRLDFMLAGAGIGQLWQNQTPATNTVAAAPTGLSMSQTSLHSMVLSWNAANDTVTPATGLSYNVRVGTSTGGTQLLAPLASTASGFRQVPALGNAQERLSLTLTNLAPNTTYYWSVQAVDTALAGSPFATETNFVIVVPIYTLGITNLVVGPAASSNSVVLGATPAGASWTATANATWLHLSPGYQGGAGSTNVIFSFDANPDVTRSGTLTIAGQTLTITQAGTTYVAVAPVTTLVSSNLNHPAGVAVDGAGNVYIADTRNSLIKEWNMTANTVTTLVPAGLNQPFGLAVDGSANVYIADSGNNAIKKWTAANNTVTTLIGSGLYSPESLELDGAGNIYFADEGNQAIKKWTLNGNAVTTLLGTSLSIPFGAAVDSAGNVYVADTGHSKIDVLSAPGYAVTTLVSSGLSSPYGLAVDGSGNVYIADTVHNVIAKWTATSRTLTTLVSGLSNPEGVAVDGAGNVYVPDGGNNLVKEQAHAYVDPTARAESRLAGSDALPAVLPVTENLLAPFAPTSDQTWLTIGSLAGGVVNFSFTANPGAARTAHLTVLGQSILITQAAVLNYTLALTNLTTAPAGGSYSVVLAVSPATATWTATANAAWLHLNAVSQSGTGSTNVFFTCDPNTGATRTGTLTIAGQTLTVTQAGSTYVAATPLTTLVSSSAPGVDEPFGVALDSTGNVYFTDQTEQALLEWKLTNNTLTTLVSGGGGLPSPSGLGLDTAGNVYIGEQDYGNISEWTAANGNVSTLANITYSASYSPYGVALDRAGNVYFSDTLKNNVEKWSVANSNLTVLASGLASPEGVAVDAAGNVYFADTGYNSVKEWTALNGTVTTLVSGLNSPNSVAVDGAGNVYIAEAGNTIRKWSVVSNTLITLLSGSSVSPLPRGVAVDGTGNIYYTGYPAAVKELTAAFVDPTTRLETAGAGSDVLPAVLPATENLLAPFAPSSDSGWLTVGAISNGVVSFSFTGNTATNATSRTGHIFVLGQTVAITQGIPFILSTNTLTEAATAGTDSVLLTVAPATNTWTATTNVTWLHLSLANQSGTGSATVTFTFDANPGAVRTGKLTIGGQVLTINQAVSLLPQISLEQPAGVTLTNGGSRDFGSWSVGTNTTLTFTVRNTGNASLLLTGTPLVAISGANAADFTVTAQPASPVNFIGATVTNAGFETPVQSAGGFTYGPSGGGWTFGSSAGLAANGSPWYVNTAPEGGQAAYIQKNVAGSIISQPVSFSGPGYYVITFYMVRRSASNPANDIAVSMDGVTLGTVLNTSQPDDTWRTFSIPYNCPSAGNHTLAFTGTRSGGDYDSAIDNVQIAGGSTTFQVSFAPAAGGLRTATLSIASSDTTHTPFNLTLTGTAIAPTPPVITGVQLAGNGRLQFTFTNSPTVSFTVWSATNLTLTFSNWTAVGSPTNTGSGVFQFTAPPAPGDAQRFYRVTSP